MELIRSVTKWGNSAGILLPREWAGKEAKVILIDRTLEIKEEVFDIIGSYLEDILGIYLTGSYARNEQDDRSDIDIIAISKDTSKEIVSGKYHISILPLDNVRKMLEKNPISIMPRLVEARAILNKPLIDELNDIKVNKKSFKKFIKESKGIIKINREFIELDKLEYEYLDSISVIYSLILRLRGVFIMNCLISKRAYRKNDFLKWLGRELGDHEAKEIYGFYRDIRDDKKVKAKIKIETAEKLIRILEKEIKDDK